MVLLPQLLTSSALPEFPAHTIKALHNLFANLPGNPHRYIYALAGLLFTPKSPPPFGGPRTTPGYVAFRGPNCAALLHYIVTGAYARGGGGDTRVLSCICRCVNRVVSTHERGCKDLLDECVLQGMRKAGHLPWIGAALVPELLRDVEGSTTSATFVEFSVRRNRVRKCRTVESEEVAKESGVLDSTETLKEPSGP
ncbi:hypothetical protein BC830DRAFT_1159569 [Chytriomyces sp. MP71]|nr:hypothetical protein BC830DRAFT_1159569 [Chytriomyces sp. MP71]